MKEYSFTLSIGGQREIILQGMREIAETVKTGDYVGIGYQMNSYGFVREIPTLARVISCKFQGTLSKLWNGERAPEILLELSDGTQFVLSGNYPYIPYDIQKVMMRKLDTLGYYEDSKISSFLPITIYIFVYAGAAEVEKALINYNETLKKREEAKIQRAVDQRKRMEEERHRESQAQYEAMKKAAEDARAAQNLDNLFRGGSVRSSASGGNERSSAWNYGNSGSSGSPVEYLFMTCACGARLRYRKNRTNVVITCASCGSEYKL